MSSRQLRKLQQQRELQQAPAKLQAEEEDSEDEPVANAPTAKPSLFANLAAFEDEARDVDDDENQSQQALSEPEASPALISKAKKTKKKKKAKTKTNKAVEEKPGNGADEIDAALRELNVKDASNHSALAQTTLDPEYERVCHLLGINSYNLKVGNEMRNLFGRTAVDNHDDAGGPVGRGARRRQRGQNQQVDLETALKGRHAPGKGLSELTLRRNNLIQGKEEWPRGTTGGLTMAVTGAPTDSGTQEFKYEHDSNYQRLQQEFQAYVEMGDPQLLIGLLIQNPYHISLLIQVSKIAKDQGDHALSSDLLERALFTFGRAAISAFNTKLSQGKVRLDFARPENRELWLAGYQYTKSLVMKGTYGTALEWTKFLLTLQPDLDPYCTRLMIHHLGLRAHEFQWLLDLYDSQWGRKWREADDGHNPAIYHTSPSLAFAALQLRDGPKCRKLLSDSMNKVPWLFFRLFKELDLDAPPSIWGLEPRTDAETLFTELYVVQTKDLWNSPEATALLMEIAHTIPKVDLSKIPIVSNSEMTLDVVRFIYLDNSPALMAMAPSNLLHRSNNSDADPLPPDHNVYSYDTQRTQLEGSRSMGGDYNNPLAALRRLLPGFPARPNHLEIPGQAGEDDGGYNDGADRELEDMMDEAREVLGNSPPRGFLQRILTSMFGGGGNDLDEDTEEATDTDDDMPGLEIMDGEGDWQDETASEGSDMESGDQMPALAPDN
ncbi:Ribosome quality control complex subunit 1 [Hyphodiscus hymeniophilus]|uniref:Ribosome quality control complex subunit 1 n=1 Tax=Hyphodiscus hymeniophilus TaxID=353542 RepID=A0A9P6SKH6_9HELO|nr:Ribosome quality control complex subunit 1 [Hyphodiscus hymeniophilus]